MTRLQRRLKDKRVERYGRSIKGDPDFDEKFEIYLAVENLKLERKDKERTKKALSRPRGRFYRELYVLFSYLSECRVYFRSPIRIDKGGYSYGQLRKMLLDRFKREGAEK